VVTLIARNANEATVVFGGSLELSGTFYVGAFGINLASVAVKMFSYLIYFITRFTNVVLSMRFAKIILQ
jgi:hypothetical protein